jgi:hypothetical protein
MMNAQDFSKPMQWTHLHCCGKQPATATGLWVESANPSTANASNCGPLFTTTRLSPSGKIR